MLLTGDFKLFWVLFLSPSFSLSLLSCLSLSLSFISPLEMRSIYTPSFLSFSLSPLFPFPCKYFISSLLFLFLLLRERERERGRRERGIGERATSR
jgi:hypothetical protein